MPSAKVVALCQSKDTLTAAVAASPTRPIGQVGRSLYEKTGTLRRLSNSVSSKPIEKDPEPTKDDLDAAEKCGRFPYRPSDLFLKIFHDSLRCLERDPFVGCCSPPLLGSSGVIPVSVISIIPDIMRHYANVILTAESEVFLATNFLQKSRSLTLINDALRKLSKQVGERGGKKIVVKFMYDRGTAEQLVHNHAPVKPQDWWKVDLPPAEDIPNIDMEVVNYHRPLLGTFHCKFMVVDRRVALISSNNIQDRANLEMMMHFEGPIVEGFYDMSLWCWSNAMKPMLPLVSQPATHTGHFSFGPDNPYLKDIDLEEAAVVARQDLKRQHTELIPQLEAADTHGALHRATGASDSVENVLDGQSTKSGKLRTAPPLVQDRLGHIGGGRLAEAVHNVLGHVRYQNDGNTQDTSGGALRAGAVMEDVNAATLVFANTGGGAATEPVSPGEVQRLTDEAAEIDKREREEMNRPQDEKPNPWRDFEGQAKQDTAQAGAESTESESEAAKCVPGEKVGTTPAEHHARTPRTVSTDDGRPSTDTRSSSRSRSRGSGSTAPTEHTQDAETGPGIAAPVPPAEVNVETAKATARDPAPSQPHQPPRDAAGLRETNPEDGGRPHVHPEQEHETFDGLEHGRHSSQGSGWSSHDRRSSSVGRRSFRSFRSKHSRHGSVAALTDHLNTGGGTGAEAGVADTYNVQDFSPFVVHAEHKPFPIALVNRPAHGMPGHEDILTPQNVAWLAGLKYAQRKVFIQTPTLNASPIVAAIIEACKRGIEVILWLNLGFNDAGEMIPFQGGTNEEVVTRLYKALNAAGKGGNLKVFWYVGKDQCVPLNAAVKKRNCHIKFMAIDDEVGIAGNGNQDTQSWFHSQEVNVMVDSPQVVAEWMEALHANQNTGLYGRVDQEGVWRYEDGRPLEHLNLMKGTGPFGRIKGFVGAFQRATGKKPIQ